MGDFTLGCLLGAYDRAQSFDVASVAAPLADGDVGSWDFGVGSGALVATEAHSSAQGLFWRVGSYGVASQLVLYDHRAPDDAYGRWFPEVTTHALRTDFWVRLFSAATSGAVYQDFLDIPGETNVFLPTAVGLRHVRNSVSNATSGSDGPAWRLVRNGALPTSVSLGLDDVLTQVDPIALLPEYGFAEQARVIKTEHRTLGGDLHTYVWEKYFAWSVPLRFLPSSHADLLNWWWENQFNLLFTLDTSDAESLYVCRIVNERQPIGRRIRPYNDLWEGVLELESVNNGGLAF